MKKKLSVIEAIIKTRNITTTELEERIFVPKGYLSKVIEGKITIKPMVLIKLLEELDITLEQYEMINKKAKELSNDSTISNIRRWSELLAEIYSLYPLKKIDEKQIKKI